MYHRSSVYLAGEPVGPEVSKEAAMSIVQIAFGKSLIVWLDYDQARALVDELIACLPIDEADELGDQLGLT